MRRRLSPSGYRIAAPRSPAPARSPHPARAVWTLALLAAATAAQSASAASLLELPRRVSVVESRGELRVELVRSGDLTGVLEVDLSTVDRAALAGEDYTATSVTLVWLDGEGGAREVVVPILDDRRVEVAEVFDLVIDAVRGDAELEHAGIRVLIEDDDFRRLAERRISTMGTDPAIATEPGGRRLVVFTLATGVVGTFVGSGAAPIFVPFPIRFVEGETVGSPDVAADQRGNFFVVWRAGRIDDVLRTRIEGRIFDRNGDPLGPLVAVSEGYQGVVGPPRVAVSNRGQIAVAFTDPDGRLVARVYAPGETTATGDGDGLRIVSQARLVDLEIDEPERYRVDASATGEFVVVAELPGAAAEGAAGGQGLATGDATMVARSWSFDGQPQSEVVTLSTDPSATAPSVAVGAEGQVAVTWSEESLDGDLDVRVAFFEKGAALDEPASVLELEADGDQVEPQVDMNAAGDTVVVWLSRPVATPAAAATVDRLPGAAATGASMVARAFDPGGIPKGEPFTVAESDAGTDPATPTVSLTDDDVVTVAFPRTDTATGTSTGIFGAQVETIITPGVCTADGQTLCLDGERFQATASWANAAGDGGVANVLPLTDDTGTFWFFEPTNVEIVIKALDACAFAQRFWVFAGGLTDVEVNLTVTDVESGWTRVYTNDPSTPFVPIQDTGAFPTCDGAPAAPAPPGAVLAAVEDGWRDVAGALRTGAAQLAATSACAPDTLCLNDDRFQATLEFATVDGQQGAGRPSVLTTDTGYFWFFQEDNVEAVVKVLDACLVNERFWVFAAGLTDVETTLTVTDTQTGETRVYENPQSTPFQPVVDTDAFASCF
jgi:hypothetical protein